LTINKIEGRMGVKKKNKKNTNKKDNTVKERVNEERTVITVEKEERKEVKERIEQNTQSEWNIGLIGHVDHGKTTIAKALSGVWTSKYSEELERGITIRIGYADFSIYKCPKCFEPECYTSKKVCQYCGSETKFLRKISIVDTPGHESLMAVMLSGASVMDGAIMVIGANEKCPRPQTAEHLVALSILGIKNVIIVQNKVDLVSREEAKENYAQIKAFVKDVFPDARIIPIAATYDANIDVLIKAIKDMAEKGIEEKIKSEKEQFYMHVIRSFDVNRPGKGITEMNGGVIGGSIQRGSIKVGDEIEIKPGITIKNKFHPLTTKVFELYGGGVKVDNAKPGGLISIGTTLDPSVTKGDGITGNVVGLKGTLPEPVYKLNVKISLFKNLITIGEIKPFVQNESIMISVGTALRVGTIRDVKKGEIELFNPVCVEKGQRIAIGRRFSTAWRLIGYGIVK